MDFMEYLKAVARKNVKAEDIEDDLAKKIAEIEQNGNALPDKPSVAGGAPYDRIQYAAPSDDEIEAAAAARLKEYESTAKKAVESEFEALYRGYANEKAAGAANYERVKEELDRAYRAAHETANDDLLKRGLARSSIAANTVADLAGKRAETAAAAAKSYADKTAELDGEIAALEHKRQKAFNDFDIAYTAKLTGEIQALKADRDNKAAEALRYNNSLAEKEHAQQLDRQRLESALYSDALSQKKAEQDIAKNQSDIEKNEKSRQIYELLRENLAAMLPGEARNAVRTNPLYIHTLNDAYYYKLYQEFGRY
ncbi:MAG: hypothetical protein LBH24_04540 [Clostridiales bacterium]|nr:hypothetical protein [Clostridiales bacterium]